MLCTYFVDYVLLEAIAGVITLAQGKGIMLSSAEMGPIPIKAEKHDLVMLLSNLLDNAIRYTPRGGHIDLLFQTDTREVKVEIVDTGPGIPENLLARVFDPFVRGNSEQEGTGLGLSIVKALAARIGARVSLSNRPGGGGLVARVALPVAQEQARW